MARCGRCGLWNQYPEDHPEKAYAGVCLWYQIRLAEDEVFAYRDCVDFAEQVPGIDPLEYFGYKLKRDDIGNAYRTAKKSKVLSIIALSLSGAGLLWNIVKTLLG